MNIVLCFLTLSKIDLDYDVMKNEYIFIPITVLKFIEKNFLVLLGDVVSF